MILPVQNWQGVEVQASSVNTTRLLVLLMLKFLFSHGWNSKAALITSVFLHYKVYLKRKYEHKLKNYCSKKKGQNKLTLTNSSTCGPKTRIETQVLDTV